jgi:hypothetical protein
MPDEQPEDNKLELAAKKLVALVGKYVGNMIDPLDIVAYGERSKKNRETVYKTLERYGYRWVEDSNPPGWEPQIPGWMMDLVGDNWAHHEDTR